MKKEGESINRLTSLKSKVSSHYLIKYNGDVLILVPDLFIAWHAGKSCWKNFKSLNKSSIGIEICNLLLRLISLISDDDSSLLFIRLLKVAQDAKITGIAMIIDIFDT